MPFTSDELKELARFPESLRSLIDAELEAGNTVVELGHGHPAAPIGAYIKLSNKVSSRPRATGDGLYFRERNGLSHSGEFTNEVGHFFVLEAAGPPPPDTDMDAIREELAERERRANADRFSSGW